LDCRKKISTLFVKFLCEFHRNHAYTENYGKTPVINMNRKKKTATKGDLIENPQILTYHEVTSAILHRSRSWISEGVANDAEQDKGCKHRGEWWLEEKLLSSERARIVREREREPSSIYE
jgi:hypothetical protein